MSKVMLSFGSFVAGVLFMFSMLSGNHASTTVHAQAPFEIEGAEPVVPPLKVHFSGHSNFTGPTQALDGLDCDGCVIAADVSTYGAGAFNCTNCSLHTNRLQLKGAADNTLKLLIRLGLIQGPKQAPKKALPPNNNVNLIEIEPRQSITLVSAGQ
jgi:hypothetical protein